ncbi:MAG: 2,3,4,5-tetrahydropyridine-2,6-dicarboxylate N-succinyltransferase [Candidatus Eisenbacteria bacterium]
MEMPLTPDRHPLEAVIREAWENPAYASSGEALRAIEAVLEDLDRGLVRVAEPRPDGSGWTVHAWVRMAIHLFFRTAATVPVEVGPFTFRDKVPLKRDLEAQQIRLVPPGAIRHGAFLEPGVVVMPAYVNIGAWVGSGTMIDTWATVGSCAQVGRNVHVSGGVGIGGVLEPVQSDPVIIEDEVFLGSRSIVVEGVRVGRGAVLGAGTVLTASTPIVDVRGERPVVTRGSVPPGVVVVPGTWPRRFPAGEFHLSCALVIGERSDSTDRKIQRNEDLRDGSEREEA